jgi:hypothetical protein
MREAGKYLPQAFLALHLTPVTDFSSKGASGSRDDDMMP